MTAEQRPISGSSAVLSVVVRVVIVSWSGSDSRIPYGMPWRVAEPSNARGKPAGIEQSLSIKLLFELAHEVGSRPDLPPDIDRPL